MAKKYIVKVSYIEFEFDDRRDAMDFAETAFNSSVDARPVEVKLESQEDQEDE